MLRVTLLMLACLFASQPVTAQEDHRAILAEKFQKELEEIAWKVPAVMGITVIDIESGERFGVNEDLTFPQGSTIKVPILLTMYLQQARGEFDLGETVTIRADDRVGGDGFLRYFADGESTLSRHDLAVLMITLSDNMATNILIDEVGMNNVTAIMAELGFPGTALQRMMIREQESARGNENLSTPAEAAALMARILTCDLPLTEKDCREMQDILAILHPGPIQDGVPEDVRLLHKSGSIAGVRTAWGAVELPGRPYALAVMGNYGDSDEMWPEVVKVASLSHWYFSRLAGATRYGVRVPTELLEK